MTCLKLHGRLAHTLQTIKQIIKSRMGDQAPALPQLKPGGNAVGVVTRDLPLCKNPFISDPESWDCACHEQMVKKCNVPDLTSPKFTACYRSLLCEHKDVCASWKAKACCTDNNKAVQAESEGKVPN